tara:strand:+ start:393 stop:749 length:357 start_codon:yes stop_codon:yes gene_type:complete
LSEIRVTTISDTAGTGPVTLTKQMACKHWCFFVGTGTATIQDSFNTSSLTDHSTGQYASNLTNHMADGNQGIFQTANTGELAENRDGNGQTCRTATYNSSGTLTDAGRCNLSFQGDLA